jgi:hypothetical protein
VNRREIPLGQNLIGDSIAEIRLPAIQDGETLTIVAYIYDSLGASTRATFGPVNVQSIKLSDEQLNQIVTDIQVRSYENAKLIPYHRK